ncbi:1-phosphofructokinase [Halomarina salina]|uniref:1-phosphofructokinase n=1 Tax=Halomarina salina TaxID=1872699 RepID=A0ABD5RM21_9EURY
MILTVTPNPALDHTLRVDAPLEAGAVARTDDAQFDPGGKGVNVSKYLTALDAETTATGFLGDPFGSLIRERLDAASVPNDFVDVGTPTRVNTTILAPDGEFKVNQNGPDVGPAAVDDLVATVERQDPDAVLVAGSLPPGVDPATVDRLARAGAWETTVDVGGSVLAELDAEYALCKPNREELAAATGRAVDTVDECLDAAEALRGETFRRVVASLGPDGAVMATPEGSYHAEALATDVVDTVGAGDALLSGVLAAFDRGESPPEALRAGIAVAARVVTVAGTGTPDFADVPTTREDVALSTH